MLKLNSVIVHLNATTDRSAKVRTGWPYILGDFGNLWKFIVHQSIVLNIE